MGLTGYMISGFVVVIGVVLGLFYWYYTDSQDTIKTLTENNSKLEISVEAKDTKIEKLTNDFELQKEISTNLQIDLQNSGQRLSELRGILQRHDLTRLSLAKPGLIETRINNGTKRAFDAFESQTSNSRD